MDSQAWKEGESLCFAGQFTEFRIPVAELPVQGDHNMLNVMMAVSAVLQAGGHPEMIRNGIADFENAPHRCQTIATIDGIRFVNDSKATNVDSVKYGFSAFEGPIVWIAGGVDKGNDYAELNQAVVQKVSALICLGRDNEKLKKHFAGLVKTILETTSIDEAIALAYKNSKPGTTVLLSPACASFDLFKNYEDRGRQFEAAVLALQEKKMFHQNAPAT